MYEGPYSRRTWSETLEKVSNDKTQIKSARIIMRAGHDIPIYQHVRLNVLTTTTEPPQENSGLIKARYAVP